MRICLLEPRGFDDEAENTLIKMGSVTLYTGSGDLYDFLSYTDPEALFVRLNYEIDRHLFIATPNLKVICSPTTGLDHIDLEECQKRGITVLSLQGETEFLRDIPATAEHTWGLILALTRCIPWAFEDVKRGNWHRDSFRGNELKGKTLGIVGLGRIGGQVLQYAEAFGIRKTLAFDPSFYGRMTSHLSLSTLGWLFRSSDIITIHVPLNDSTRGLIGAKELVAMKPTAFLVNTSRGQVIDEAALETALQNRTIAGAALDVLADEWGEIKDNPLVKYARTHQNLLLTPHLGGCTVESMAATERFMVKKLQKFMANGAK